MTKICFVCGKTTEEESSIAWRSYQNGRYTCPMHNNMTDEYVLEISMRRFLIIRDEDVSGVSGTGVVAEGCVLSSSQVIVHWFSERQSVVIWNKLEDALTIHGHGGKTHFEWIDSPVIY